VDEIGGVGEPLLAGVDDDVDAARLALAPHGDIAVAVLGGQREAHG